MYSPSAEGLQTTRRSWTNGPVSYGRGRSKIGATGLDTVQVYFRNHHVAIVRPRPRIPGFLSHLLGDIQSIRLLRFAFLSFKSSLYLVENVLVYLLFFANSTGYYQHILVLI